MTRSNQANARSVQPRNPAQHPLDGHPGATCNDRARSPPSHPSGLPSPRSFAAIFPISRAPHGLAIRQGPWACARAHPVLMMSQVIPMIIRSRARSLRRSILSGLLGGLVAGVGSGCDSGTQIPLADVPPPPAVDPSLRKKVTPPNGGSPDTLSYPGGK
jgi:hypothetical protein